LPDFILLVDDGRGLEDPLHLVMEIKGLRDEHDKAKKETMETYWIPGVNNLKRYGRWGFAELTSVWTMETDLVYLPLIRYTFFILEFSAIFHEKTPNRAFDDGDTHDWTDKYCGYNTLILHVIFYITQKTYTKLFS
jgi:hypothetical protein